MINISIHNFSKNFIENITQQKILVKIKWKENL